MNKKLSHIFTGEGKFRFPYNPYGVNSENEHFHSQIFDENGDVHYDVANNICKELKKNQYSVFSDIVKVHYADSFSANTRGNYAAICLWR